MKKLTKIALYSFTSLLALGLVTRIDYKTKSIDSNPQEKQKKVMTQDRAFKPNAQDDLVLQNYSWQKEGDGSIGFHTFSIHNVSKNHNYSTITVQFSYYSEIGDKVGDTDKVLKQPIKAGETIHIDKLETRGIDQHADGADMHILK